MKAYNALGAVAALPPVDIFLHKVIPDGAGLGGGSSDAAFTLKALNSMFSLGIPDDDLAGIAATLGADCLSLSITSRCLPPAQAPPSPLLTYRLPAKHSSCETAGQCADCGGLLRCDTAHSAAQP